MAANESEVWDHIGRLHSRVSEVELRQHEGAQEAHHEPVRHESVGEQLGKGIAAAIRADTEADKALAEKIDRLITCVDKLTAALEAHGAQAQAHHEAHERRHAELLKAITAPRTRVGEVQLPHGKVAMKITEK